MRNWFSALKETLVEIKKNGSTKKPKKSHIPTLLVPTLALSSSMVSMNAPAHAIIPKIRHRHEVACSDSRFGKLGLASGLGAGVFGFGMDEVEEGWGLDVFGLLGTGLGFVLFLSESSIFIFLSRIKKRPYVSR